MTQARAEMPDAQRSSAPADRTSAFESIDPNGDVVFRFRLDPMPNPESLTLEEVYRQAIHDLLHLVRFYHRGQPVLVDEFAFLDAPDVRVRILDGGGAS